MSTKEPELQDFGITPEEYALYTEKDQELPSWQTILKTPVGVFLFFFVLMYLSRVGDDDALMAAFGVGLFCTGLYAMWGIAVLVGTAVARSKKSRLLASPVASQIKLYEEACVAYREAQREAETARRAADRAQWEAERARQEAETARRRKLIDHWMLLSGAELESELATLCRNLGYRVETTPASGDRGVDLILRRKSGKTTVVQCKSHKAPVGPAVARELYGSMMDFGADRALLVCTGGFTRGVNEFVKGKPIKLLSASDLPYWAKTSGEPSEEQESILEHGVSGEGARGQYYIGHGQYLCRPKCRHCRHACATLDDPPRMNGIMPTTPTALNDPRQRPILDSGPRHQSELT